MVRCHATVRRSAAAREVRISALSILLVEEKSTDAQIPERKEEFQEVSGECGKAPGRSCYDFAAMLRLLNTLRDLPDAPHPGGAICLK